MKDCKSRFCTCVCVLRYHIVAFPSIARHAHMCKHVLLLRFTLHHMFIVGVQFWLFLYNCVPYRIIELNYLNLRTLDIPRYTMNPHDIFSVYACQGIRELREYARIRT